MMLAAAALQDQSGTWRVMVMCNEQRGYLPERFYSEDEARQFSQDFVKRFEYGKVRIKFKGDAE